jgi:outer membrane protein assembly complex protein YaeT
MIAMERMARWVRLFAATTCVLLAIPCARAQEPTTKVMIEDVIPSGNLQVPTQRIVNMLKSKVNGEFKQEVLDEDIRILTQTKLFMDVRADKQILPGNKIRLFFILKEYPSTIQEVIYQGNKHLKPEELETITGLRKGAPLNHIAVQMGRQAILRRYNDMGRMLAGVEILEGDKPGDRRVVYSITEGQVAKVSQTRFEGCTFVTEARLRSQIETSRAFLDIGGGYDAEKIEADVHHLEEYYKNFGYHDVKVNRELVWSDDHRHVTIIFHIDEGIRYRVASVHTNGNKILSEDKLLADSRLKPGEYYNKGKANADLQLQQVRYGYEGYAVNVHEQNYFPAPGQVAVSFDLQEKPPAKVGDIIISGNEVTRDNVIRRQIGLYPGQTLTYPDLKVAEKNLARLNIFEVDPAKGIKPTVSVLDPDSDKEFKDILVTVQEQPTGSLIFGVGVNSDAGLNGSIALNERNFDITRWPTSFDDLLSGRAFRGAGQEFRAEAVPGTNLQRYSVSWREPSLFDSPYGFGVSAYYYDRVYTEYTEARIGTRFTLDRKINQLWRFSETLRVEQVGVYDLAWFAPWDFQKSAGNNFQVGLRSAITRDSRDSYLRPTEGSLIEASVEQFGGTACFTQAVVEANKFFTIYERADGSGRQVLSLRSVLGWSSGETPVYERFYAGGYRSLRGFAFRGVGHFEQFGNYNAGGDFEFLNSAEYQVPILANDQLWAVAFCDTGTVNQNVSLNDYRVAVGAGLRIVVPILGPVPIALDFGIPIVKGPEDRTQLVSFWVGFFH